MSLHEQLAILAAVLAVICVLWHAIAWARAYRSAKCYSFNPLKGDPPHEPIPCHPQPPVVDIKGRTFTGTSFKRQAKKGIAAAKPFQQGKAS